MKGKISKKGYLFIIRGGKEKHIMCPFQVFSAATPSFELSSSKQCGDWCPQFGELYDDIHITGAGAWGRLPKIAKTGKKVLSICHGKKLIFDEFEDER